MLPGRVLKYLAMGGSLISTSCLPDDTRPPPGKLLVSIRGSDAATSLTTDDGYLVRFERFLVSIGPVRLRGSACDSYSEPTYGRLVNAARTDAQKLNEVYALGQCEFGFRVAGPDNDTLLTEETTQGDYDRLRVREEDELGDNRVAIEVVGTASNGAHTKRFAWSLRERVFYEACENGMNADPLLNLRSHDDQTLLVTLHADALFATDAFDPASERLFSPFVAADDSAGDGDGVVTTLELASAEAPLLPVTAPPRASAKSLADLMRTVRFPAIARISETVPCDRVGLGPELLGDDDD